MTPVLLTHLYVSNDLKMSLVLTKYYKTTPPLPALIQELVGRLEKKCLPEAKYDITGKIIETITIPGYFFGCVIPVLT